MFLDIDDEDGEADELELGVLAGLTVANEADPLGLSDNRFEQLILWIEIFIYFLKSTAENLVTKIYP